MFKKIKKNIDSTIITLMILKREARITYKANIFSQNLFFLHLFHFL